MSSPDSRTRCRFSDRLGAGSLAYGPQSGRLRWSSHPLCRAASIVTAEGHRDSLVLVGWKSKVWSSYLKTMARLCSDQQPECPTSLRTCQMMMMIGCFMTADSSCGFDPKLYLHARTIGPGYSWWCLVSGVHLPRLSHLVEARPFGNVPAGRAFHSSEVSRLSLGDDPPVQ